MGIFDRFKPKKEPKTKIFKRSYAANNQGYLFSDFKPSESSADTELRPALRNLRARSRDLARNNEYVRRYLDLLRNNVVGDK
jgi:capsid protein